MLLVFLAEMAFSSTCPVLQWWPGIFSLRDLAADIFGAGLAALWALWWLSASSSSGGSAFGWVKVGSSSGAASLITNSRLRISCSSPAAGDGVGPVPAAFQLLSSLLWSKGDMGGGVCQSQSAHMVLLQGELRPQQGHSAC
jgi:hypothetical protein